MAQPGRPMSEELKVKAWSLAQETRYIRLREKKRRQRMIAARKAAFLINADEERFLAPHIEKERSLQHHRITVVRPAARATNLARGFLRGHDYLAIENKTHTPPDLLEVSRLVKKYGQGDDRSIQQQFAEWLDTAKTALRAQGHTSYALRSSGL